MKKQRFPLFITLTLAFAAFTLGFFLGSSRDKSEVRVSVPAALETAPAQTLPPTVPTEVTEAIRFPIDLNTATEEELMALPGIGETYANRILSFREANGPFSHVEALLNVEGIGEKRLEDILPYITIGG